MGSRSDLPIMEHAAATLRKLEVAFEMKVVSAHRTPDWLFEYAEGAEKRGLEVIIAGAGGAAHLPGMLAAKTLVPVLGVPIDATVPVGTLAVGKPGAINAALLAAAILANHDSALRERLASRRSSARDKVLADRDIEAFDPGSDT